MAKENIITEGESETSSRRQDTSSGASSSSSKGALHCNSFKLKLRASRGMFNWGALEAYLRLYVLTKFQCALSDVLPMKGMKVPQARVSFKSNLITNVKRRVTRTASGGANGTLRREIQHNPKQDSAPNEESLGSGKGGLR